MSDDNIETKIDSTNDTGASDCGAPDSGASDSHADRHDHGDQERSASVRDAIKSAWAEQTGSEPEDSREASREARRRRDERKEWERPGRAARAAKENAAADAAARDPNKATDSAAQSKSAPLDTSEAPKSWRQDEKAHYDALPQQIKNAIHRREQSMQEGVESLKTRYADMERNHRDIAAALEPHLPVIRSFGHTPAQSIAQMFAWFDALSTRPDESFPVLLRSFNYDPRRLTQLMGYGQQQQAQAQRQQQASGGQIDPQLYQYLQSVEHRLSAQQQMNEAHQMAQTQQVLNEFAKDKPYFERVRRRMGELLQPDAQGRSIIPLTPEGHVNLLEAYNMAVRSDEELNNQMFAERAAAEKRAAKEAADRARRSGSSLMPRAPAGNNNLTGTNAKSARKSVRDSLLDAVAEHSGNSKY